MLYIAQNFSEGRFTRVQIWVKNGRSLEPPYG